MSELQKILTIEEFSKKIQDEKFVKDALNNLKQKLQDRFRIQETNTPDQQ